MPFTNMIAWNESAVCLADTVVTWCGRVKVGRWIFSSAEERYGFVGKGYSVQS